MSPLAKAVVVVALQVFLAVRDLPNAVASTLSGPAPRLVVSALGTIVARSTASYRWNPRVKSVGLEWMFRRCSKSGLMLAILVLAGCASEATQVIVEIDATDELRVTASRLVVDIIDTEGVNLGPDVYDLSTTEVQFPIRIALVPKPVEVSGNQDRTWDGTSVRLRVGCNASCFRLSSR